MEEIMFLVRSIEFVEVQDWTFFLESKRFA